MTRPPVFAQTLQLTDQWLADITAALGHGDGATAHAALRAVLQALRDRLPEREMAQFSAQLPLLLRGVFFEGWVPGREPAGRSREAFLQAVTDRLHGHAELGAPDNVVRAVLTVIGRRVSPGEAADVRACLPKGVRELWPAAGEGAGEVAPTTVAASEAATCAGPTP